MKSCWGWPCWFGSRSRLQVSIFSFCLHNEHSPISLSCMGYSLSYDDADQQELSDGRMPVVHATVQDTKLCSVSLICLCALAHSA